VLLCSHPHPHTLLMLRRVVEKSDHWSLFPRPLLSYKHLINFLNYKYSYQIKKSETAATDDFTSDDEQLTMKVLLRLYLYDSLDNIFKSIFKDQDMAFLHNRNHQLAERINEPLTEEAYTKFLFAVSSKYFFRSVLHSCFVFLDFVQRRS
jgi:hypothetical protein